MKVFGFVVLVVACARSQPAGEPPPLSTTTGVTSASHTREALPSAQSTALVGLRIACECRTGPVPAPPGTSPVTSRSVVIAPDGSIEKTTHHLAGSPEVERARLDAAAHRELDTFARKLYRKRGDAPPEEQPVPDGMVCTLRLSEGAPMLTLVTPHPSKQSELGPLLAKLVALLPP